MRRFRFVAAASSAAIALAIFAVDASLGAAASHSGAVRISGTASPAGAKSPRVGSVAPGARIDFEVELGLPDRQGAQALARAVSTPGSPTYGQFLTPAQWEQRFSPAAGRVAEVSSFLRQSGFAVGSVSADRMAIEASGTAAQIERAFETALSYHWVQGAKLRLADTDLSVPAALAGIVAGVTGISQTVARPDDTTGNPESTPSYGPQPPGFRVAPPCGTYYGQKIDTTLPSYGHGYPASAPWAACGYTPPQFRSAYGLGSGDDGSGVTVAVVDAYASPTLFSDAQKFASLNDPTHPLLSAQFSELLPSSFNDGDVCGASGWFGEQSVDVEAVHGTAPGAHILFAGGRNCGEGDLNAVVREIVDRHLAEVITNSYGENGGDLLDDASVRASVDNVLLMAAGTGVSVLFSSGDNGDEFTTLGAVVADYPPSSPWATAVGGTTLQIGSSGQRLGEFGWSTARSFLCNETYVTLGGCNAGDLGVWGPIDEALNGGSGGGTSFVYHQPFYQIGVVPSSLSERNAASVGTDPMRVEPDISMEADPATGMLVGETQTFPNGTYYDQYRIGGTSVSSPLFAGVVARADETAGHTLGFLNPRLYSLYGNASALYDVQAAGKQDQSRADYANSISADQGFLYSTRIIDYQGQEKFCNAANECTTRDVALSTGPGYDSMTGLGSPGNGFVQSLSGH